MLVAQASLTFVTFVIKKDRTSVWIRPCGELPAHPHAEVQSRLQSQGPG